MKNYVVIENMELKMQGSKGTLEFENGKYSVEFLLRSGEPVVESIQRYHKSWDGRSKFLSQFDLAAQDAMLKALIKTASGEDMSCTKCVGNALIMRDGEHMWDVKLVNDCVGLVRRWRCGELSDYECSDFTGDKFVQNIVDAICVMASAQKVMA